MLNWIDIHSHLHMLEPPVEKILERAQNQGVTRLLTIATEPADWPHVLATAKKFWPQVACTLGVHPHSADQYNDDVENELSKMSHQPYVVALGEMGLDFYYKHSDPQIQRDVFARQLALASDVHLPVQIHSRDADAETLDILRGFRNSLGGGVIHCFTGTWELAKGALDLGLDISISGIITFKKAEELRDVIRKIPLDRLHLETDAPYLSPVPHRGKANESSFLPHTAQVLADLKQVSLEELANQVQKNNRRIFPRLFLKDLLEDV